MLSSKTEQIKVRRPYKVLVITVITIFFAEIIVMFILSKVEPQSIFIHAIADSSLLVLISFPILYFLIIDPLYTRVDKFRALERDLLKKHDEFQESLKLQEESLLVTDKARQKDILERKKVENELLNKAQELLHLYETAGMKRQANNEKSNIEKIQSRFSDN
jgi:hypothetical protein